MYRGVFIAMKLYYWFLFPISIGIATLSMASGIGGATFFSPLFIIALKLSPEVAIGTALLTEVFGFASGLYAYAHRRLIDYNVGIVLLIATVPLALIGTWLGGKIEPDILKVILGIGLFAVALSFLRSPDHNEVASLDKNIKKEYGGEKARTCLVSSNGERICYTVCNKTEGMLIAGLGGLFVGMISTGLGELNGYFLLRRCRVPSKVSVATSVFVVAITALCASIGHFIRFVQTGSSVLNIVLSIVMFTIPGVVIGGQLGSKIARTIPQRMLEIVLAILFIIVAILTIGEVVF
jgi:uncharacterized membrane protein YfcA